MNGIRLNLSHGMLTSFEPYLNELIAAERECAAKVEIVIDMEGPELRIGQLNNALNLCDGDIVNLGDEIPLRSYILEQLEPNMICRLDDGKIELVILKKDKSGFLCKVTRGGVLKSKKSFAVLDHSFIVPVLTDNDISNLRYAAKYDISAILQPFVRSANDIIEVRKVLNKLGLPNVKVIAKIEDINGLNNADEIILEADTVLFARGDLGNCLDLWLLPSFQKKISQKCIGANKPLIIATQLLASMENKPVPTRAEMNDIYNSVIDGATGLMLTGETAAGKYPVESIGFLAKAAEQAYKDKKTAV